MCSSDACSQPSPAPPPTCCTPPPTATLETEAAAANPSPQDGADAAPPAAPETISRDQGALAWVQYMRYLRRTGDTMGSRQLFLRARKWALSPHFSRVPWQVYAAAALLEWQVWTHRGILGFKGIWGI